MAALASVTFALFLASLFAFIRRGFDKEGHFQQVGFAWGIGSVLLFVGWLWALHLAPPPYPIENTRRYEAPKQAPVTTPQ